MKIELKIINKEFYTYDTRGMASDDLRYNLPTYATPGSAAIDLICTEDVKLNPGECRLIPTGLAIHIGSSKQFDGDTYITPNWSIAGIIAPRSGRGHKEGLVLGNTIGLIDEDFRGEIMVSALNRNTDRKYLMSESRYAYRSNEVIYIRAGERFAQLFLVPVVKAKFTVVDEFSNITERGAGGFGSTGVKT